MLADQLNVDAPVTAKQAAEERRGSRFVRSCFSLAELERQLMSSQPEEESVPPLPEQLGPQLFMLLLQPPASAGGESLEAWCLAAESTL